MGITHSVVEYTHDIIINPPVCTQTAVGKDPTNHQGDIKREMYCGGLYINEVNLYIEAGIYKKDGKCPESL